MADTTIDPPKVNDPSWAEAFLNCVHNIVSVCNIPVMTPSICIMLNERISSLRKKRFDEFFINVIDYVKKLDQLALISDEFAIATEMVIEKIVSEHNKNKRKRFADIYKSFIQLINSPDKISNLDDLEIFLSIISILSDDSIFALITLKESGLVEPFSMNSDTSEKFKKFIKIIKQRCRQNYYYRAMAEMEQAGVVSQASGFWSGNMPFVTNLGLDFLQWLESIND